MVEIVVDFVKIVELFDIELKVVMMSFLIKGLVKLLEVDKVVEVIKIVKKLVL